MEVLSESSRSVFGVAASSAGLGDVTPRGLLLKQLEAGDPYRILDMIQMYVIQLRLRKKSKEKALTTIRSFFLHNRCALPSDLNFKIRGDKPPVQGKLTEKEILEACNLYAFRYRSLYLVKWQSFSDNARLEYISNCCADQVVRQVRENVHPVRIDIPGIKANENDPEGSYYTFIGRDAVEALKRYFKKERKWPTPNEPIWTLSNGKPVTIPTFSTQWLRLLRKAGIIPKRLGNLGDRYGFKILGSFLTKLPFPNDVTTQSLH